MHNEKAKEMCPSTSEKSLEWENKSKSGGYAPEKSQKQKENRGCCAPLKDPQGVGKRGAVAC